MKFHIRKNLSRLKNDYDKQKVKVFEVIFKAKSKKTRNIVKIILLFLPILFAIGPVLYEYRIYTNGFEDTTEWDFKGIHQEGNSTILLNLRIENFKGIENLEFDLHYTIEHFGNPKQFDMIPLDQNISDPNRPKIEGRVQYRENSDDYSNVNRLTNQTIYGEIITKNVTIISQTRYSFTKPNSNDDVEHKPIELYPLDTHFFEFEVRGILLSSNFEQFKGDLSFLGGGSINYVSKLIGPYDLIDNLESNRIKLLFAIRRSNIVISFVLIPILLGYFALLGGSFTTETKEKVGELAIGYSIGLLFAYTSALNFIPTFIAMAILGQLIAAFFSLTVGWIEKGLNSRNVNMSQSITDNENWELDLFPMLVTNLILWFIVHSLLTKIVSNIVIIIFSLILSIGTYFAIYNERFSSEIWYKNDILTIIKALFLSFIFWISRFMVDSIDINLDLGFYLMMILSLVFAIFYFIYFLGRAAIKFVKSIK